MKITYWHIECTKDASAYDIRTRTKKEALQLYRDDEWNQYAPTVSRLTLQYESAFDLLDSVLSEGGFHCLVIDRKDYPIKPHS